MKKFKLTYDDWEFLEQVEKILKVRFLFYRRNSSNIKHQIPAAFQDILSFETTPTLCHSVPAFDALRWRWVDLQENDETPVQFYDVLKAGLEKIEDYQGRTDDVPVYVLAMGKCQFFHQDLITDISISS